MQSSSTSNLSVWVPAVIPFLIVANAQLKVEGRRLCKHRPWTFESGRTQRSADALLELLKESARLLKRLVRAGICASGRIVLISVA